MDAKLTDSKNRISASQFIHVSEPPVGGRIRDERPSVLIDGSRKSVSRAQRIFISGGHRLWRKRDMEIPMLGAKCGLSPVDIYGNVFFLITIQSEGRQKAARPLSDSPAAPDNRFQYRAGRFGSRISSPTMVRDDSENPFLLRLAIRRYLEFRSHINFTRSEKLPDSADSTYEEYATGHTRLPIPHPPMLTFKHRCCDGPNATKDDDIITNDFRPVGEKGDPRR